MSYVMSSAISHFDDSVFGRFIQSDTMVCGHAHRRRHRFPAISHFYRYHMQYGVVNRYHMQCGVLVRRIRTCHPAAVGVAASRTVMASAVPSVSFPRLRIGSTAPPRTPLPGPRSGVSCRHGLGRRIPQLSPRPDCLHLSHGSSSSFRVRVPGIRVTGSLRLLPRSRCHGLRRTVSSHVFKLLPVPGPGQWCTQFKLSVTVPGCTRARRCALQKQAR